MAFKPNIICVNTIIVYILYIPCCSQAIEKVTLKRTTKSSDEEKKGFFIEDHQCAWARWFFVFRKQFRKFCLIHFYCNTHKKKYYMRSLSTLSLQFEWLLLFFCQNALQLRLLQPERALFFFLSVRMRCRIVRCHSPMKKNKQHKQKNHSFLWRKAQTKLSIFWWIWWALISQTVFQRTDEYDKAQRLFRIFHRSLLAISPRAQKFQHSWRHFSGEHTVRCRVEHAPHVVPFVSFRTQKEVANDSNGL